MTLVDRLRALTDNGCKPGIACAECQARFDAADEIERLEARVATLTHTLTAVQRRYLDLLAEHADDGEVSL